MRAEEIFKQFFGGDIGSMFGQDFGDGMSQKVRRGERGPLGVNDHF